MTAWLRFLVGPSFVPEPTRGVCISVGWSREGPDTEHSLRQSRSRVTALHCMAWWLLGSDEMQR